MTDFMNRVRNVTTGRPASAETETAELPREPQVPPLNFDFDLAKAASALTSAPPPASANPASTGKPDLLGIAPAIRRLAEYVTHSATKAPLAIGILGQAGAGKSFALDRLLNDISAFSAGASRTSASPFISQIVVARVDAATPGDPATRIAAALFQALQHPAPDGRAYPELAEEASDAVVDPSEAARIARERLADGRRRLDSEREALRDMNARRTRLVDSVLYEASGSRIDAHARSKRNSIESRLRSFGFTSGDAVATYKDLVRDVADNGGIAGRVRACLRALWGFRGQTKLIVLAIVFFAAAWGIGEAQASRASWLGWLSSHEALKTTTTWIEAHISWLSTAKQAAIWAGVLALAFNVIRAARFILPIFRGVTLYKADLETRHRDLDTLIGNQTRRVDDLAGEIEPLTKRAAEAERREAAAANTSQKVTKSPFAEGMSHQADGFIAALATAVASNSPSAPRRIVVAFDNLDALSANAASNYMAHAQQLLSHPAYITILTAGDEGKNGLSRFVDIPLRLSALTDANKLAGLVRAMLATGPALSTPEEMIDAGRSTFDRPIAAAESGLLETLAPIAANAPRDVRRFVSAYRLARGNHENYGPIAVALAVQSGALESEKQTLDHALEDAPANHPISVPGADRINFALDAARAATQTPVTAEQLREARVLAAQWSL